MTNSVTQRRPLGRTDLQVSPVSLGCWPIAGVTSLGVTEESSLATLEAAVDSGINFFDTAYIYGHAGESETRIRQALIDPLVKASPSSRDQIVIATKAGLHWNDNLKMVHDATPATLRRECETSLQRLGTDRVELLYLHAPDPDVPLEESAGELKRLMDEGKTRSVGVSNLELDQLKAFQQVCPITAFQPPYNMILRDIEADIVPWCVAQSISICVYWPLMKGLLAGKLARDHQFDPKDGRPKYPMFQGEEWQRNQDLIDDLRPIADEAGKTLAQLTINWAINQLGITSAICGAKRPDQIEDTAAAMGWQLSDAQQQAVDAALAKRGEPVTRWAI